MQAISLDDAPEKTGMLEEYEGGKMHKLKKGNEFLVELENN